jgi:hypothetical protein
MLAKKDMVFTMSFLYFFTAHVLKEVLQSCCCRQPITVVPLLRMNTRSTHFKFLKKSDPNNHIDMHIYVLLSKMYEEQNVEALMFSHKYHKNTFKRIQLRVLLNSISYKSFSTTSTLQLNPFHATKTCTYVT